MSQPLRFYEADGHRIAVRVLNEKRQGRPLVLLHGMFMSLNLWPAILPASLRDRPLYCVGLPAHYPSRPPSQFMRRPMAESLFTEALPGAMLTMIGRKHFDLLGHCAGGYAALCIAAALPKQVNKLGVVSGFAHGELLGNIGRIQRYSRLPASGMAFAATRLAFSLNAEVARWGAGITTGSPRAFRAWARQSPGFATVLKDLKLCGSGHIRHFARQLREHDVSDRLKHIESPTLIIQGGNDPVVPAGQARMMQRRIPQASIRTIKEAGHLPFAEAGPQFEQLLTEWYGH